MDITHAIREACKLQSIWVGKSPTGQGFDLAAIRASIAGELAANRQRPTRCSAGNKSQTHADAIKLGKIRKALAVAK